MGMERKQRVTHRDVARLANVSTAVVSYVVNNGPRQASPEARERVLRAIAELGYHPNAFAQSLRGQRTHMIGFITNDLFPYDVFLSPYSAGILTGLISELKAHEHYLLIYPQVIGEDIAPLNRLLRSGRLDGVVVRLIQDPPVTDSLMETIAATDVPCVCIERPAAERFGFKAVTYDDALGATTATRYLIEHGHRRIAHLCGDVQYATAQSRLQGYRQALYAAGLPVDEQLIQGDTWDTSQVADSMLRLLALAEPPTAIFAASDNLALGALEQLRKQGFEVPRDMALIGFDDIQLAEQSSPPLTTVRIPLAELGRQAADRVLRLSADDQAPESVTLPVELIRRGTV
ncbi:MAG: LacI family transcriptional regulator [Chloroflexota bacterium]|nr:LacI family transcriptional regulator [Chloroflexota bacterium]PLS77527.1 MAG: LacI family transcriptional regulator [Chloroflexota bacterium]